MLIYYLEIAQSVFGVTVLGWVLYTTRSEF